MERLFDSAEGINLCDSLNILDRSIQKQSNSILIFESCSRIFYRTFWPLDFQSLGITKSLFSVTIYLRILHSSNNLTENLENFLSCLSLSARISVIFWHKFSLHLDMQSKLKSQLFYSYSVLLITGTIIYQHFGHVFSTSVIVCKVFTSALFDKFP